MLHVARIRKEYQSVLTYCARLASFSSSLPIDTETDVNVQQVALAEDDLVAFALHSRRLLADTEMTSLSTKVEVPTVVAVISRDQTAFRNTGEAVAVSRLTNIIIHHDYLRIFRTALDLREGFPEGLDCVGLYELLGALRRQKMLPKLALKSRESKLFFIDLAAFMAIYLEHVFNPVVDHCADQELFLQASIYGEN
jgi:hypothetical protein